MPRVFKLCVIQRQVAYRGFPREVTRFHHPSAVRTHLKITWTALVLFRLLTLAQSPSQMLKLSTGSGTYTPSGATVLDIEQAGQPGVDFCPDQQIFHLDQVGVTWENWPGLSIGKTDSVLSGLRVAYSRSNHRLCPLCACLRVICAPFSPNWPGPSGPARESMIIRSRSNMCKVGSKRFGSPSFPIWYHGCQYAPMWLSQHEPFLPIQRNSFKWHMHCITGNPLIIESITRQALHYGHPPRIQALAVSPFTTTLETSFAQEVATLIGVSLPADLGLRSHDAHIHSLVV